MVESLFPKPWMTTVSTESRHITSPPNAPVCVATKHFMGLK